LLKLHVLVGALVVLTLLTDRAVRCSVSLTIRIDNGLAEYMSEHNFRSDPKYFTTQELLELQSRIRSAA
jgi:hypothetical protein